MEISSVSGMQVGMNLGGTRSSSSVDSEEFAEKMSSKFLEENDADGDGQVSADEFSLDSDLFDSIDEDGDGLLSQEELRLDAKARMTEMQASFDSKGMNGEAPPSPPSGGEGQSSSGVTEEQDSSESGESGGDTGQAASASSSDSTDSIDTNGDGVISQEELMAYLQATMGSMVADSATATQSSGASQQFMEQTGATSGLSSGSQNRAIDAYDSMQQSMFGESQDASLYTYSQTFQESLSLTV
ncbi:MAG: EF-hand domain-containing protein [Pseudodesulfovibrio sp.]